MPGIVRVAFVDGTTEAETLALASAHGLTVETFSASPPPSAHLRVPEGDEDYWIGVLEAESIVVSAERVVICWDGWRETGCAP